MAYGLAPEGGSTGQPARHPGHGVAAGPTRCGSSAASGPARWGFFLRAETMHGFYTYLEENPAARASDAAFHEMSHGESFLAVLGATLRLARLLLPRRAGGRAVVLLDPGPDRGRCSACVARRRAGAVRDPLPGARGACRAPRSWRSATGGCGVRRGRSWSWCSTGGLPGRAGPLPAAPARRTDRPPGQRLAEQRHEHRVGAVPVRPQLDGAGQRAGAVGHPGQQRRSASSSAASARVCEHRADHARGLGQHRRAGGVEHHAAGADQVQRRPRPAARWSSTSADQVVGLAPPARLGPAAQRAQPGARRVDEDPVEGAGRPRRRGAVGGDDAGDAVGAGEATAATSPARCGCRSPATSRAPRRAASAASSAALPPGPAHRSSQRRVAPVDRGGGQRHRDQLRALVLDAGAALGDGRDRARVAALEDHAVRRVGRRLARQLVAASTGPGRATRVTRGRLVVGGEQVVRARASPTALRSSSTTHCGWL